jgi:hypothetical protein
MVTCIAHFSIGVFGFGEQVFVKKTVRSAYSNPAFMHAANPLPTLFALLIQTKWVVYTKSKQNTKAIRSKGYTIFIDR